MQLSAGISFGRRSTLSRIVEVMSTVRVALADGRQYTAAITKDATEETRLSM